MTPGQASAGHPIGRLIDAAGNRLAEGLRCLEDLARFTLDAAGPAREAKRLRHAVRAAVPALAIHDRDVGGDIGASPGGSDHPRPRLVDLVRANACRASEAARSLEEALRLLGPASVGSAGTAAAATATATASAAAIEQVRYDLYRLELAILARLPAWRLHQVRLYALIDTSLTDDPVAVAAAVAQGGAGAVQLRAKQLGQRAYRELAARMRDAVTGAGALFIVNDHVAVARALQADGVHLGQDDLALADARSVVAAACAIGISCHTPDQVDAALAEGADYLGLGPMHATATKPHEPERGPRLLDAVRLRLDRAGCPSFAIGGLDAQRIADLRPRLPHGVAVGAALCRATDPRAAAAALHDLLVGDHG